MTLRCRTTVRMKPDEDGTGLVAAFAPGVSTEITSAAEGVDGFEPEPDPVPDRQPEDLPRISETLTEIRDGLAQIIARDELLGRLHERLAKYEEDHWTCRFVEPLTRKLTPIHRRLSEQMALLDRSAAKLPSHSRRRPLFAWMQAALEALRVELEITLSDFGVDVFTSSADDFDRSQQEPVEQIQTSDASLVGKIARRISPGFKSADRVVIPERVVAYVSQSRVSSRSPKEENKI